MPKFALEDLISSMPEPDQQELLNFLKKKFPPKKSRESVGLERYEIVSMAVKLLRQMEGLNMLEMRTVLKLATDFVELGGSRWKNPGRDTGKGRKKERKSNNGKASAEALAGEKVDISGKS